MRCRDFTDDDILKVGELESAGFLASTLRPETEIPRKP